MEVKKLDQAATVGDEQQRLKLLVPICVNLRQKRADDGTCSRWALECIAWSLIEASSGRLIKQRTLNLGDTDNSDSDTDEHERDDNDNNNENNKSQGQDLLSSTSSDTSDNLVAPASDVISNNNTRTRQVTLVASATLAEAIKQIGESMEPYGGDDKCALVTCGPLHLRQHLHPAAMRAGITLPNFFDRYVDLPKEFQRTYHAGGALMRAAECSSLAASSSLSSSSVNMNFASFCPSHQTTTTATTTTTNETSFASSSAASCASSGSSGQYAAANMQPQSHLYQDTCYCWYCYFCDYCSPVANSSTGCNSPPTTTAGEQCYESLGLAQQAATFYPTEFYSTGALMSQERRLLSNNKAKQHPQVAATITRRQANGAAVGQQLHHHNQRQLRQVEEMFKFLSIESQPVAAGSSQSASCRQQQQQQQQEEEITRCEKCHLAAAAATATSAPRSKCRSRQQWLLDDDDEDCGATEETSTSLSSEFQGDNDDDDDDRAEEILAAADEPSAQVAGNRRHASVVQANEVRRNRSRQQALTAASTTAAGHCSACSALASAKLVDAMSQVIERMLREGHQFNRFERIKRVVEVGLSDSSANDSEHKVVRARGLPWQATEQEIANFFIGLNIARGGVSLCLSRQGRRNGEALIQFESREHRNLALGRHKHFMGQRYIEVYRASGEDFTSLVSGYNNKTEAFLSRGAQVIVRMRGLPFTCTSRQVVEFFSGAGGSSHESGGDNNIKRTRCEVLGQEEGVLFVKNHDDKPTGDAFVLFASEEFAQRALQKHKQNIGPRYVELFRSSISEVQQVLSISKDMIGGNNNSMSAMHQPKAPINKAPADPSTKGATRTAPVVQQLVGAGQFTYAQAATGSSFAAVAAASAARTAMGTCNQTTHESSESGDCSGKVSGCVNTNTSGSTTSSAFDNNSVSSSELLANTSDDSAGASGSEGLPISTSPAAEIEGAAAEAADAVQSAAAAAAAPVTPSDQVSEAANQQQSGDRLLSSTAQSPVSSLSTGSSHSCYRSSSLYSAGQRGVNSNTSNSNANDHNNRAHYQHNNISNTSNINQNYYHRSHNYHQQQQHHHNFHHHNNFHHNHHNHLLHHQQQQQHQQFAHQQYPASHYHAPVSGHQGHLLPGALATHHHHQHRLSGGGHSHHHHPHNYHPAAAYAHYPHLTATPAQAAAFPMAPFHQHHQHQLYAASAMAASARAHSGQHQSAADQMHYPLHPYHMDSAMSGGRADCVRLHGLPFEAQVEDVLYFLGEQHSKNIVYQGVHMVYSAQGQPSGEAIVQMNSTAAAANVAQEFHRKVMTVGKKQRYVELSICSIDDLNLMLGIGLLPHAAHPPANIPVHHHQHQHQQQQQQQQHQQQTHKQPQPPLANPTDGHYLTQNHQLVAVDNQQQKQQQQSSQAEHLYGSASVSTCDPRTSETSQQSQSSAQPPPVSKDDSQQRTDMQHDSKSTNFDSSSSTTTGADNKTIDKPPSHTAQVAQQQQQVTSAAAAFMPATYYPILYYYPQHPQMLAAPPYH